MREQTTKEKLKAIGEWLFQNKDALRKDDLSVQYVVLSPDNDGGAHVFGVYAINEDNLWHVFYDVLKEFYADNPDYDSFEEYMDDVREQCLEWFEEEEDDDVESVSLTCHPETGEDEEIGEFFDSE